MNKEYFNLLKQYISFKSISTDPVYKDEIKNLSLWLKEIFEKNSFNVEVVEGYDNPIILANYVFDESLPTCLIYGHYDVQPASKDEGWEIDPFELNEKDGRLIARGIIDNKGQNLLHIFSVFELIKSKKLKFNIKFFLEGNEETGSPLLEQFISDYKEKLKCDLFVISDGEFTMDHPALETSFRGIVNSTVTVKTSTHDLHSGTYGGAVPNAVSELVYILSKFKDENGNFVLEGLENSEDMISQEVLDRNKNIPFSKDEYLKNSGTKAMFNKNVDIFSRVGILTSMEITGIQAGYMGVGYRNAIPSKATAKINFRLNPDLEPQKLSELFINAVNKFKREYVEVEVKIDEENKGVLIDTNSKYIKKAEKLLSEVFGKKVLYTNNGAIIPVVKMLIDSLNAPAILVPIGNEDCNMHAVNENYKIEYVEKGIDFSMRFFGE